MKIKKEKEPKYLSKAAVKERGWTDSPNQKFFRRA